MGNICRSPMAEGIMRHKAENAGLNWFIDSAGTGGWHSGEPPDHRAVKKMQYYNINIANLRARQIKATDLLTFDLVYVMDMHNYNELKRLAMNNPTLLSKVKLILNEVKPGKNLPVPDPYYGGDDGFETVYQLLQEACKVIVQKYGE